MKMLVFYRPASEHARTAETFVRDIQRLHDLGDSVDLINVDTRDGTDATTLYDIWSLPAIVVVAEDGHPLNSWQGEPLPLMDDVLGYMLA